MKCGDITWVMRTPAAIAANRGVSGRESLRGAAIKGAGKDTIARSPALVNLGVSPLHPPRRSIPARSGGARRRRAIGQFAVQRGRLSHRR